MTRGCGAAAVLVALATALAPPAQAGRDRTVAIRVAIAAANRELMARIAGGHGDEVESLYAADAMLIPPGAPPISGRAAIAAYWERLADSGVAEALIRTEEVVGSRDAATEVSTVTYKGKDTSVIGEGRAVVVWKKLDGRWLLFRDVRDVRNRW